MPAGGRVLEAPSKVSHPALPSYFLLGFAHEALWTPIQMKRTPMPVSAVRAGSKAGGSALRLVLVQVLLQLLLSPFKGVLAWNLLLGRSTLNLASHLQRLLLRLVGWLAASPGRHAWMRAVPHGARRWHLAAGAPACREPGVGSVPARHESRTRRPRGRQRAPER